MNKEQISGILRNFGYKATPAKIKILQIFFDASEPQTASKIIGLLEDKMNQTTVYRTLEKFEKSGLVKTCSFKDGKIYYELTLDHKHHHHLVCENCNMMEDIDICHIDNVEKKALKQSNKFQSIRDHSLEFFGICKKCAKKQSRF